MVIFIKSKPFFQNKNVGEIKLTKLFFAKKIFKRSFNGISKNLHHSNLIKFWISESHREYYGTMHTHLFQHYQNRAFLH